jgi:hypothetical protein
MKDLVKKNKYNGHVKRLSGANGEDKLRRSVTIQVNLNQDLLTARGQIMSTLRMDIDYTTALNIFLEIGLKKYFSAKLTQEEMQVILKHLSDENLKKEGKLDELTEMFNEEILKQMTSFRNYLAHQKQ